MSSEAIISLLIGAIGTLAGALVALWRVLSTKIDKIMAECAIERREAAAKLEAFNAQALIRETTVRDRERGDIFKLALDMMASTNANTGRLAELTAAITTAKKAGTGTSSGGLRAVEGER